MIEDLIDAEVEDCAGGSLMGYLAEAALQAAREFLDGLAGPNA